MSVNYYGYPNYYEMSPIQEPGQLPRFGGGQQPGFQPPPFGGGQQGFPPFGGGQQGPHRLAVDNKKVGRHLHHHLHTRHKNQFLHSLLTLERFEAAFTALPSFG